MLYALAVLLGLALTCTLPWLFITADHSDHLRLIKSAPVGTSLPELRSILRRETEEGGAVQEWIPADRHDPRNYGKIDGSTVENTYGTFRRIDLGELNSWNPTHSEQDAFTGQVEVFVDRALADPAAVVFTIVNGKVVEVDWGYLPG